MMVTTQPPRNAIKTVLLYLAFFYSMKTGYCGEIDNDDLVHDDGTHLYRMVAVPFFMTDRGQALHGEKWVIQFEKEKDTYKEDINITLRCRNKAANRSYCTEIEKNKFKWNWPKADKPGPPHYLRYNMNTSVANGPQKTGHVYDVISIESTHYIKFRIISVLDKECTTLYNLWPNKNFRNLYSIPFVDQQSGKSFFSIVAMNRPAQVKMTLVFNKETPFVKPSQITPGNPFGFGTVASVTLARQSAYLFIQSDFQIESYRSFV